MERFDECSHVCAKITDYRGEGVLIGVAVEIDGCTEEMVRGVSEVELIRRSSIAPQFVEDAKHTFFRIFVSLFRNCGGLSRMLEDKILSISRELAQVMIYGFVTAMNAGIQARVIHIYPESFALLLPGAYLCQSGVLEGIGIVGGMEVLEAVLGQVHTEIAVGLGHKALAAAAEAEATDKHYVEIRLHCSLSIFNFHLVIRIDDALDERMANNIFLVEVNRANSFDSIELFERVTQT